MRRALGFYIPTLGLVHRAARRMGWTEPFALTVGTVVGALYWIAFLIRSVGSARAPMIALLAAGVTFPLFLDPTMRTHSTHPRRQGS